MDDTTLEQIINTLNMEKNSQQIKLFFNTPQPHSIVEKFPNSTIEKEINGQVKVLTITNLDQVKTSCHSILSRDLNTLYILMNEQ